MLVWELEPRHCMARTTSVVAIFHDGHHRTPPSLARWSAVMSSRLVLKSSGLSQQMVSPSSHGDPIALALVWKRNVV